MAERIPSRYMAGSTALADSLRFVSKALERKVDLGELAWAISGNPLPSHCSHDQNEKLTAIRTYLETPDFRTYLQKVQAEVHRSNPCVSNHLHD